MTADQLEGRLRVGKIDESDREKVIDFLLYYGILGTRLGETDHFIYSVNYDPILHGRRSGDGPLAFVKVELH
jgi:hypothetical protein